MATRQAAIKLTLRSGAFQSEIRRLSGQVSAAGRRMGASMRGPMTAGLNSAKKSLAGFGSQLKGHIKMAATLGGALAIGSFIKDAIVMESRMKALSFTTGIMTGEARDWRDIQSEIQLAAVDTARTADEMTNAFARVLDATKDLKFTSETLKAIGYHATGADRSVEAVAGVVQMLRRQLKVTAEEIPEVLAAIDELSRQGGPSFEELADGGDNLAAIMQQAGLQGVKGFKLMLGIMNEADASMAGTTKMLTGLQVSLQKLRDPSVLKRMAKDLRLPAKDILAAENSFEAMKVILSAGEKGLMRFREEFKGPEAAKISKVYAAPFVEAYRKAKEAGVVEKKAVEIGLAALDDAFKRWSETSLTESLIKERAAKRAKDADASFRVAVDKIKQAFADPELQAAVTDLAESLPAFAKGVAAVVKFITEQPLTAAGIAVGGRVAAPMAAGFAAAAAPKVAAASIAKMSLATKMLIPGMAMLNTKTAAAAGALGVMAAGIAGWKLGELIREKTIDPAMEKDFGKLRSIDETMLNVDQAIRSKDVGEKKKALEVVRAKAEEAKAGPGGTTAFIGSIVKTYGIDKLMGDEVQSAEAALADKTLKLTDAEIKLTRQIAIMERQAGRAADALGRVDKAVPPAGTQRGPKQPGNSQPGAEPTGG